MPYAVTLIPGDGTGPEITEATRRVLEATGVQFEWEVQQAGLEMLARHGSVLPDDVIESIKRTRVGLKGPITTPIGKGSRSANVALRKKYELFANFRPIKNLPGIPTRYPGVDLIIVRENTEGEYSDAGGWMHHGTPFEVAIQTSIFTRAGCERLVHDRLADRLVDHVGEAFGSFDRLELNLGHAHPLATAASVRDGAACRRLRV